MTNRLTHCVQKLLVKSMIKEIFSQKRSGEYIAPRRKTGQKVCAKLSDSCSKGLFEIREFFFLVAIS